MTNSSTSASTTKTFKCLIIGTELTNDGIKLEGYIKDQQTRQKAHKANWQDTELTWYQKLHFQEI